MNERVLITVCNEGWLHKSVVHVLLKIQHDRRYRYVITMPTERPYENNLHHCVNTFMDGAYDFWLNIDSDNPPRQNPLDLVELDKDIIGLPTPVWHFTDKSTGERPVYWNAYDDAPKHDAFSEHMTREGLQRVAAVGTGCFLIARRVFEHPGMRQAPFARKCYRDGTVNKGNDLSFCERARARGFEVYCHYGYPCDHYAELELNEVVKAYRELYSDV